MAFLASNVLPADAYKELKREAVRLKSYCQDKASQFNNDTKADDILRVLVDLKSFEDNFDRFKSIQGLSQYAIDQEQDQNYNVVEEFNSLSTAITTVKNWVADNYPKDTSGHVQGWTINATTKQLEPRIFPSSQIAQLRTHILTVAGKAI